MTFKPANDAGKVIEFSLGTLDDDITHRPDVHIFTGNRANWFESQMTFLSISLPENKTCF